MGAFAPLPAVWLSPAVVATEATPSDPGELTGLLLVAILGVVAFVVGHATRRWVSEVIVFLGIGIVIGPEVLGVIDAEGVASLEPVISLALGAIVFGIGERLELPVLRQIRHTLTPIAVLENAATAGLVFIAMLAVGLDVGSAFLLAAIALSTSPTTVVAVISERRARGGFTDHVLAATALNNVASALLYGIGLPVVLAARSTSGASQGVVAFAQLLLASLVIGGLGAFALRRFMDHVRRPGERLLFVLVVLVSVVAVSDLVGAPVVVSTLLAGALTANDPRDTRPLFESLRTLEAPIFLVFFVVAGAGVHFAELREVGGIAALYVAGRAIGKVAGGWIGTDLTRSGRRSGWGPYVGAGLMPFAGMAIGLAAFTLERMSAAGLEDLGGEISAVVLGSVVIFELIGPFTVGRSLDQTGESGQQPTEQDVQVDENAPHLVRHILVPISSPEMARRKAPQVVDLAASTNAVLTALHIVAPGQAPDETVGDPALSFVRQAGASRGVQVETVVREAESVVDAILEEAERAAVDLIVLGEPAPRLLDRGGGRRIIHEVASRVAPGVRVMVVPTVLESRNPTSQLRAAQERAASESRSR